MTVISCAEVVLDSDAWSSNCATWILDWWFAIDDDKLRNDVQKKLLAGPHMSKKMMLTFPNQWLAFVMCLEILMRMNQRIMHLETTLTKIHMWGAVLHFISSYGLLFTYLFFKFRIVFPCLITMDQYPFIILSAIVFVPPVIWGS